MAVLIVDDNADVRAWFDALFGEEYSLIGCASLDEVKTKWETDISLCVLDQDLGQNTADGVKIAEWIRTQSQDVPIVWLTSSREEDVYEGSLSVGAVAFLTKPMIYDQIAETLDRYS